MARFTTLLYGGVLIVIALIAMLTGIFDGFPEFLPALVLLMGVLILFTPMYPDIRAGMAGVPAARPKFQWVRRWVFGVYLILASVMSYFDLYTMFPWGTRTSVYDFVGQLILIGIGLIYLLAAFERTRDIQIGTY